MASSSSATEVVEFCKEDAPGLPFWYQAKLLIMQVRGWHRSHTYARHCLTPGCVGKSPAHPTFSMWKRVGHMSLLAACTSPGLSATGSDTKSLAAYERSYSHAATTLHWAGGGYIGCPDMPRCLLTSALGGQYGLNLETRDSSGVDSCLSYKLQWSIAWPLHDLFLSTKTTINDEMQPKLKLCIERQASVWLQKLSCP